MTKIIAISDTHGNLPEIPDCDILLHAGDICPDFASSYNPVNRGVYDQGQWLDTEFREWLEDLHDRKIKVVGIWGNHDFVGEDRLRVPVDLPWTLLQDNETTIDGIRIYGTPWVPNLPFWAFHARESTLTARAAAIPDGLDVLLSHGPPYGVGDSIGVNNKYGSALTNVGDRPLLERLETMKHPPPAVVCGHIHEDYGIHHLDKRRCVDIYNVAHVNEMYEPVHPPTTIW